MTCQECSEKVGNAIPAVCVSFLIIYSFYVYIVEMCIYKITDNVAKFASYVAIFCFFFAMMVWSFLMTMFTPASEVPDKYQLPDALVMRLRMSSKEPDATEALMSYLKHTNISLKTRTENGGIRYCSKCAQIKPDRSHHCSTCKICVLKMDHHCPWTNCCICFSNYKMFLLFNIYSCFYCAFYCATVAEYSLGIFLDEEKNYWELQITVLCITAALILLLLITLMIYHLRLVFKNITTLEDMGETYFIYNEPLTFNISPCYNWKEVFGDRVYLWWIPIYSGLGNGTEFYTTFE